MPNTSIMSQRSALALNKHKGVTLARNLNFDSVCAGNYSFCGRCLRNGQLFCAAVIFGNAPCFMRFECYCSADEALDWTVLVLDAHSL